MVKAFYNTIELANPELRRAEYEALNQEQKILRFFLMKPYIKATPFDIQRLVLPSAPITSVRRAMTNLTDRGYLEKTNFQKMAQWGKVNFTWQLKTNDNQMKLL